MICDLPIAYPDELLYSLCARYSERMQYPSARGVIRDLFGSEEIIVTVGFPGYLGNLVSNLSPGHHYSWFGHFQVGCGNSVQSWSYSCGDKSKSAKRCFCNSDRGVTWR